MAVLTFQLDYHTTWGQEVCICGSTTELGNFNESQALHLNFDGNIWSSNININESKYISYYYLIKQGSSIIRREWGSHRNLYVTKSKKNYIIHDFWKNKPYHFYLYTSVFTETVFKHNKTNQPPKYFKQSVLLNVICPYVSKEQQLCISGNCDELGNWDIAKSQKLTPVENGLWQIVLNASKLPDTVDYKFVIVDKASGLSVQWEDGDNRHIDTKIAQSNDTVFAEMALLFNYNSFKFKGTGTAIPLFSLRSEDSFGIGDFADLRKMADWTHQTGQNLIQLLPVNDTTTTKTWRDSYPYSAISINALHPIYLGCKHYPLKNKTNFNKYLIRAQKLNKLKEIDYEQVLKLKEDYCRDLYIQDGSKVMLSEDYIEFYNRNSYWLFAYACFCYLRDINGTANFREWGSYSKYNHNTLQKLICESPEVKSQVEYNFFIQYLLHKQFSETKDYAHSNGVTLKGDIPIGISRNSVEAWTEPYLFNMDTQTGAPPDDFSFFGQNWGFPTYNWQAMEEDGYRWWKSRFKKMSDYFDAYRIDHILGFFRIWEIPLHSVHGLLGYFNPALPYWAEEITQEGIHFDEQRMVEPFINESYLPELFGNYTEEVMREYLNISGWQQFKLKPFCNTQQKIKALFAQKDDEMSITLREGLYSLCNQVLFVRDPHQHHRFHPRITAQYNYSFKFLSEEEKSAFNRLYDRFYFQKHDYFWREQAMKKLPPLINSTDMMVCGEDLGMVPNCVPSVMDELQILSLEIERMPKDPYTQFTNLKQLPYLSVCTTSTHDMSPLRLWWAENREVTQQYYNLVLQIEGKAPLVCSTELCKKIIENHLKSNAMWVILPWQDWMSIDETLSNDDIESERINVPSNPKNYWRYRMHISLEQLLNETGLNDKIKGLIDESLK